MKLILARHGEAESFSLSGSDKDRLLNEKGRSDITKMAKFISGTPLKIAHIFHSPYHRTKETSKIFGRELNIPSDKIEFAEELAPGADYTQIFPRLQRDFTNSDTIMLVSHNPDISYFAAQLIKDMTLSHAIQFLPGTTIAINLPKETLKSGQILWMISPEFLR